MISAASQSFVVAELEAEKKLSERLKAALQESTDINSRMLLANSAYQRLCRTSGCDASRVIWSVVVKPML
jgi:hypothetical protein